MDEIVVENPTCESCGVDVRPGAEYCYNCGGYVGADEQVKSDVTPDPDDKARNFGNGSTGSQTGIRQEAKLKSAAALRKQKNAQRKPVEVVWEPRESAPSKLFIFSTILFLLFAAMSVLLALYFK